MAGRRAATRDFLVIWTSCAVAPRRSTTSARIVYRELKCEHGFEGSYETVKRAVAALRQLAAAGEVCLRRFETEPGQQSQIDWGQVGTWFGQRSVRMHLFVLTLGLSRRGFTTPAPTSNWRSFCRPTSGLSSTSGGSPASTSSDRPRTVCYAGEDGKRVGNPTFKSFAEYWGFEPRLCRAYRAQTKGKVESGVKYVKRNFMPGRVFVDIVDFQVQLDEWNATIADRRVHGTTHEQPVVRFEREKGHLLPLAGQPGLRLPAKLSRIVPEDWLVSFQTHRYVEVAGPASCRGKAGS
jgi:transposase